MTEKPLQDTAPHNGNRAQLRDSNDNVYVVGADHTVQVHLKDAPVGLTPVGKLGDAEFKAVVARYEHEMKPIVDKFNDLRKQGIGGNPSMAYPDAGPVESLLAPFANKAREQVKTNLQPK